MLDYPLERALGHDSLCEPGAVAFATAPDVRHVFANRVEGVVVHQTPSRVKRIDVDSVLGAMGKNLSLHRVGGLGLACERGRLEQRVLRHLRPQRQMLLKHELASRQSAGLVEADDGG